MAEQTEVDKAVAELADALYTRYCEAVGGKAFDERPLPTWQEFSTNPHRKKQADAWVEVAKEALRQIVVRPMVAQIKSKHGNTPNPQTPQ